MLSELKRTERAIIRNHYSKQKHPLFLACDDVFYSRSSHLNAVDIEAENIFVGVAHLLDELFKNEGVTQRVVDRLWAELFKDIRGIKMEATEHDKQQVTHTIFAIVRKLMCHHWNSQYCYKLYDMLGVTISREMRDSDKKELEQFSEGLFEHSEGLDDWINCTYDGNLSGEIETLLKGKNDYSEDEGGSSYDVLNDRLNETKIVQTIKDTQRHNLGQIDFSFAVHNVLESLNWLNDTMDTHFMAWMKSQGIIKIMTKNLKKAKSNLNTQNVEKELKNTFQTINPDTGNPMDKLEFYKRKDAKLINNGK